MLNHSLTFIIVFEWALTENRTLIFDIIRLVILVQLSEKGTHVTCAQRILH
jgi:hypothetical protein